MAKDAAAKPSRVGTPKTEAGTAGKSGARGALQRPASADYAATTSNICVIVRSFYLADESRPDERRFVWAYRVRIENRGRQTVQLLRRTWRITDAHGREQQVRGEGVVGEQPVLEPGEAFEYTSGTPLETPSGFMAGFYHMVDLSSGEPFDVVIPHFSLDSPHCDYRMH